VIVRQGSGDSGQAAVELALAMPILVVLMLAILQIAVAVRDDLAVELAAREGARAAAVTSDIQGAADAAARRAIDLPIDVATARHGDHVTVTVTYVDPTDMSIIGAFIGPITHTASVTMVMEPP
jgi:Flp pilus assembly protein TadG